MSEADEIVTEQWNELNRRIKPVEAEAGPDELENLQELFELMTSVEPE